MTKSFKIAVAALTLMLPIASSNAGSKAGEAAFDELLKCRDRYPDAEPTLFWRCAKTVLTMSKIEPRRVNEAINFGDYVVSLHLKGQSTAKELNKQLADILAKATD